MRLLIQSGSEVNIKSNDGNTPLHHAVRSGELTIFHYFKSIYSKNSNCSNGFIVCEGHTKIVGLLLNNGADAQIKDNGGKTPREIAVEKSKDLKSRLDEIETNEFELGRKELK